MSTQRERRWFRDNVTELGVRCDADGGRHILLVCVRYAVCDLAQFSIRARVYPKAVAVLLS